MVAKLYSRYVSRVVAKYLRQSRRNAPAKGPRLPVTSQCDARRLSRARHRSVSRKDPMAGATHAGISVRHMGGGRSNTTTKLSRTAFVQ